MSNFKILNDLERIESLIDGIWGLNKVYRTSEETSASMRPHLPSNWESYDTVETFPIGKHIYGYDNRKAPLYHHVHKKPDLSSGYQSYLHSISLNPDPFNDTAIIASSSMGNNTAEKARQDPWPAPKGHVSNVPWTSGNFPSVGETAVNPGSQGYGIGPLLYQQMLKYHGRLTSDVSTSSGADKLWDKVLQHPNVKGSTGFDDRYHRHWAEWHGEPINPPTKVLNLGGGSYNNYLKQQGLSKSEGDKIHSSSDPIVHDISRAPEQHVNPEFYRITPQVQQAYEMMGRGNAVAHGQFVSDPSPSIGSGVTVAFDNDQELHDYIKNVYEPHLKKNVFPSLTPNKAVFLAPIPSKSIKHGNHSPFLTINHLHGVSLSQDKRGRVPFYYAMSKLASELGHQHPLIAPAISEYNEGPHQHHTIRIMDGNGRTVSARTAGSSHVLSYVAVKPEHVHSFLKMLHEVSPQENMKIRSILGVNDLPSEFSVNDIPTVISHTKKSEEVLKTLDRMETLFDALSGRF